MKTFKEIYGFEFGHHGKRLHVFRDNTEEVEFSFKTPAHVEEEVSFYAGDQYAIGGDRVLMISDKPGATEDTCLYKMYYLNGTQKPRISMFVNDTDTDPKPPVIRDSSQPTPYRRPRTTWLKPDTTYYCRLVRLVTNARSRPLFIQYAGTSPKDGVEIPLERAHSDDLLMDTIHDLMEQVKQLQEKG